MQVTLHKEAQAQPNHLRAIEQITNLTQAVANLSRGQRGQSMTEEQHRLYEERVKTIRNKRGKEMALNHPMFPGSRPIERSADVRLVDD